MELTEEPEGLQHLARKLAAGLTQEQTAVLSLRATVEEQIHALYNRQRDVIEDTTLQTSKEVHTLQRLRAERQEYIALILEEMGLEMGTEKLETLVPLLEERLDAPELIDQLRELYASIPEEVEATREKCRQLAYSLQYALHLGHAFIEAVQGAGSPPPIQVYTSAGETKIPTNRRMMINKIG